VGLDARGAMIALKQEQGGWTPGRTIGPMGGCAKATPRKASWLKLAMCRPRSVPFCTCTSGSFARSTSGTAAAEAGQTAKSNLEGIMMLVWRYRKTPSATPRCGTVSVCKWGHRLRADGREAGRMGRRSSMSAWHAVATM
jgi:hypothetical protein